MYDTVIALKPDEFQLLRQGLALIQRALERAEIRPRPEVVEPVTEMLESVDALIERVKGIVERGEGSDVELFELKARLSSLWEKGWQREKPFRDIVLMLENSLIDVGVEESLRLAHLTAIEQVIERLKGGGKLDQDDVSECSQILRQGGLSPTAVFRGVADLYDV
ncbi:MAG: hypothetical protein H8D78_20770 [Chloroflexi bacterium]|nr:hypothetical protein [Chloroflexota bacterium]